MFEAEVLLAHTLSVSRTYLYTRWAQTLDEAKATRFADALQRRCQQEPMAYIIGTREFWSLELKVSKDTLIPRPETELLVELVLTLFADKNKQRIIADLGTGSGALALALSHERPAWQFYATDINSDTLQVACDNAQQLGLTNIIFSQGDWCTALPSHLHASFDVVVSNPPYIAEHDWNSYADGLAFEPRCALTSGVDGLDAIRAISQGVKPYLMPGGYLVVEHGCSQSMAVQEIFSLAGYSEVSSFRDLAGHERAIVGRYFS
jgi:release factor glutamine methyltransferase